MKPPGWVRWANRLSVSLAIAVVLGSSAYVAAARPWFQDSSLANLDTSFPALGIIRDKLSHHR
jgi:hypothetical protein